MLKTPEEYPPENTLICRKFTNSRTLLKSITRPLQGGGRWFEPSIAHLEITWKWRYFERAQGGPGSAPGPVAATVLQPERSCPYDSAASIASAAESCMSGST